jgi:hypothetical protein
MPGGGDFGGAAAFLGGLTRGLELGNVLADRSLRKEAQEWSTKLGSELSQANSTRYENQMRIAELSNTEKTVGLDDKGFAELENRITNTMSINATANIQARDALSRFAVGGASNKYIQAQTIQFHDQLTAQETADANMVQQWQTSARDLDTHEANAAQHGLEGQKFEEQKAENLRADARGKEQIGLERERVGLEGQRVGLERDQLAEQKRVNMEGDFGSQTNADLGFGRLAIEERQATVAEADSVQRNARDWASLDAQKQQDKLRHQEWQGDYNYRAYADGVEQKYKERDQALRELLAQGDITDAAAKRQLAVAADKRDEARLALDEKQFEYMKEMRGKEWKSIDERVVDEVYKRVEASVDQVLGGADGDAAIDEAATKYRLDPRTQREGIRKRMISEAAGEQLDSMRGDKTGERPPTPTPEATPASDDAQNRIDLKQAEADWAALPVGERIMSRIFGAPAFESDEEMKDQAEKGDKQRQAVLLRKKIRDLRDKVEGYAAKQSVK